jgi:6-phosphogluconate dehydrogenase
MVHNGIEYAIMEAIAEAYDVMKRCVGLKTAEIEEVIRGWNTRELRGYLLEITEKILQTVDPESSGPMVEVILDVAEQKGTGRWSTQSALDTGTPTPTIAAAVFARSLSALKQERLLAEQLLGEGAIPAPVGRAPFLEALFGALLLTVTAAYAQGFRQLSDASRERGFGLDTSEVARVWMGGCIIRADILTPIRRALLCDSDLKLLFLAEPFRTAWFEHQAGLRKVVGAAHQVGVPIPAFDSTLNFVDGYRAGRLPANLIQAQRDYFGAHTYQRTDRDGNFHTQWEVE